MKFSVIASNFNAPKKIVEFARVAEESGFDHFLLSDPSWFEEEPDFLDSGTMLALLAGETSTLTLGTCVTPITFRPPLQLATIVTTLDNASEGRIIVGVGAGWAEPEFRLFSTWHPYEERYAQFLEALQLLTRAWTMKSVSFSCKFYNVEDCIVEPKPVQKSHPPLLFGDWGNNRIVRLAGEVGDGWTPTGPRSGEAVKTPSDYRFASEIENGRNVVNQASKEFDCGCRFGPLDDPREYTGEVESYRAAGSTCHQLCVNVKEHSPEVLRKFGDAVIATS
ncbi:MAG TPA: LLM class flavin-dependent oxidoreductase [Candidatus Angelobacter sp.]|nr:LLM class flavin-dependent oxidoreductase [Candidatus Angelobacter sp.]